MAWRLNKTAEDEISLHGKVCKLAAGRQVLVLEGASRGEEEDAHPDRTWLCLWLYTSYVAVGPAFEMFLLLGVGERRPTDDE